MIGTFSCFTKSFGISVLLLLERYNLRTKDCRRVKNDDASLIETQIGIARRTN